MAATLPRDRFRDHPCTNHALAGSRLVRHLLCMLLVLSLAGCGGGSHQGLSRSPAPGAHNWLARRQSTYWVTFHGRPKLEFPDPANPGKTGVITVQPHDHCKVSPA